MPRKIVPDVLREQTVVHLTQRATAREAARLMRRHNVGSALIIEDEALKGILTVADMAYRVVAEGRNPDNTLLGAVMTSEPDTIGPDTTAIEALRLMQDGGYRHLPVVENGKVLGVVSRRDFHATEAARIEDETALWERI